MQGGLGGPELGGFRLGAALRGLALAILGELRGQGDGEAHGAGDAVVGLGDGFDVCVGLLGLGREDGGDPQAVVGELFQTQLLALDAGVSGIVRRLEKGCAVVGHVEQNKNKQTIRQAVALRAAWPYTLGNSPGGNGPAFGGRP
ncbi:MAG: hypothetical protein WDN45_05995 [Caulobacteraceae bacterium]